MVSTYNLGVNSQVQKKTKFAFLAHQAKCKNWGLCCLSHFMCARGTVRTTKSASLDGMRAAIFTVHSQLFVMFLTPGPALVSVV